jgi:NADPH-dependent glutamate synthase beta subunit-like oxidoreductase
MSERYEFNINQKLYEGIPCQTACPVHTDVRGYVTLISQGRFEEAYNLIRETNPFPSVCGRVCQHFCERDCSRQRIDQSVSICTLKRAASDYILTNKDKRTSAKMYGAKEKVAIIGAGPAGLTTAHDLAKLGYRVTVFESLPVAGGMLMVGIPSYRLPRDIIQSEVDYIRGLGVDIRFNTAVGRDIQIKDLMRDYRAILIAAGAHKPVKLNIPGEEYGGLIHGATFMRKVNLNEPLGLKGKRVAVVGGGFTAMDVSRSSIRLGASEVYIIYRRTREEIPVNEKEIIEAEEEGVQFKYLIAPVRILSKDGKNVSGMECIKNELGEPDKSGRRKPVPIKGSEFVIDVDVIVPAVSQAPDNSVISDGIGFKMTNWGTISVDSETLATNIKGIFACGDFLTGTRDVINVIADGHRAAVSIDKFLNGADAESDKEGDKIEDVMVGYPYKERGYDSISRHKASVILMNKRLSTFEEVEKGFTEDSAILEGKRCLQCNHIWTHLTERCFLCKNCEDVCPVDCLTVARLDELAHNRFFNENIPLTSQGITPVAIKREICIRCGLCEQVCPVHAITFTRKTGKKETVIVEEVSEWR